MARIHAYRILNQYFEDESFLNIALNEELKKSELIEELVKITPNKIEKNGVILTEKIAPKNRNIEASIHIEENVNNEVERTIGMSLKCLFSINVCFGFLTLI